MENVIVKPAFFLRHISESLDHVIIIVFSYGIAKKSTHKTEKQNNTFYEVLQCVLTTITVSNWQ